MLSTATQEETAAYAEAYDTLSVVGAGRGAGVRVGDHRRQAETIFTQEIDC